MGLKEPFREYVEACFSGIWVETSEPNESLAEIADVCRSQTWQLALWDVSSGLQFTGADSAPEAAAATDPLAAIRSIAGMHAADTTTILVLSNFHRFLQSTEILQTLANQIIEGKSRRLFYVVVSPIVQLPPELEKLFVVIEHGLPDRQQLLEIARSIATEPGELPEGNDLVRVIDAAAGLTRYEAEGAVSLSLVRTGTVEAATIWELKSQALRKDGLLGLHRGSERFDQLGGLANLKAFCLRAMRLPSTNGSGHRARGVLLLSPPGCGKSQFAKALGNEVGRPTLTLDMGHLLGSLVGQSEHNIRKALAIADAMQPCILFCDEIEKALSGALGSQGDSGVSARLFGTLLTWLNDHTSDVFFIGTCNDISKLPPEFSRAERFDGVFFVDLPGKEERRLIWAIYLEHFGIDREQRLPDDSNWTGAEIKACCRLAALLDVPLVQAALNVVPVSVTASESIERLRNWASGRCLSADQPGIFSAEIATGTKPRRRVSRDTPSN